MRRIFVLSLESEDYIYKESKETSLKRRGGPAFYIKETFDDLGINYGLAPWDSAKVEIRIIGDREVGKILKFGRIKLPRKIAEPNILISTIGPNDLDLNFLSKYKGNVFLDIQGFVRCLKMKKLGTKKTWKFANTIINNLAVLKGTSEELRFLPQNALEKARNRILLETKGTKGVTVWETGKKIDLIPPRVIKTDTTIGAGDTFMAAFVYKFIHTQNAQKSARFALKYTNRFITKINR